MYLVCDNQKTLHIDSNPIFHERIKHVKVNCHFIREILESGDITSRSVNFSEQLTDIFIKSRREPKINYICSKLGWVGTYNLYTPV